MKTQESLQNNVIPKQYTSRAKLANTDDEFTIPSTEDILNEKEMNALADKFEEMNNIAKMNMFVCEDEADRQEQVLEVNDRYFNLNWKTDDDSSLAVIDSGANSCLLSTQCFHIIGKT